MNGQPMDTSMPNLVAMQACGEPVAVVVASVGDLTRLSNAEFWARIEAEGFNIRRIEREIADREGCLTTARYPSPLTKKKRT